MENSKISNKILSENDILLSDYLSKNSLLNQLTKEVKILKDEILEKMQDSNILRSKNFIANLTLQDRKEYMVKACTVKILKVNPITQ